MVFLCWDMVQGFLSLDPAAMEYPDLSDYHYVLGNPITFIDPTGRNGESTRTEHSMEGEVRNGEVWFATYVYYKFSTGNTPRGAFEKGGGGNPDNPKDKVYTNFYGYGGTTYQDTDGAWIHYHMGNDGAPIGYRHNGSTWEPHEIVPKLRGPGLHGYAAGVRDVSLSSIGFVLFSAVPIPVPGLGLVNRLRGVNAASGSLRLGSLSDDFIRWASKAKPLKGHFDVIGHGTQFTIQRSGTAINHRVLARLIQNNPKYHGQSIRLLSCNTGACNVNIAQNLASKLNVNVIAPNNTIWAFRNGALTIGRNQFSNTGRFITFKPGGGL